MLAAFLFDNWEPAVIAIYVLLVLGLGALTTALFALSKKSVYDEQTGVTLYSYYQRTNKVALVASWILIIVGIYIGVGWL